MAPVAPSLDVRDVETHLNSIDAEMASVQVQKSVIETKTAIDQKQSLELVQTMLHSGLSTLAYIRYTVSAYTMVNHLADFSSDFFADGAFDEIYYETRGKSHSYLDYASGNAVKALQSTKKSNHTKIQVLRRGRSRRVDTFLDWLEKGAFVALEAGNLDALQVYIHPDEECRTNVLEQYTFKILYASSKQNQRAPISLEVDSPGRVRTTVEASSNALQALLRQLASLSSVLPVLPAKRYISLKLCYIEGAKFDKLAGFMPGTTNQLSYAHARGWKQHIDTMTKFRTVFHSSTLEVLSLQPLLQSTGAGRRNALFPKSVEYAVQQDTDVAGVEKEVRSRPLALTQTNMSGITTALTVIDKSPEAEQFQKKSNTTLPPDGVMNQAASRLSVAVKPVRGCLSKASNRIASHFDAVQRMRDHEALEMGAALRNMMQPEQITQGDTQSQGLKPHGSPTASSTTIVSPSRPTVSPLKSVPTTFIPMCKPKLLQHKRKALEQMQERRRAEVRKRRPSKARGSQKSTVADVIDCHCGHMAEEGDMVPQVNCTYCDGWQHLHCYGYTGSQDSRLPEEHACYKCLLGEEETPLSRRLTDLSLMRRGIHFAQEHGLTTQQQFGKDMGWKPFVAGPIFVAFGRAGYVVDNKTSRRGSDALKPRLVVVKSGPDHEKMLEELFNPMLHIAHHYEVATTSAALDTYSNQVSAVPVKISAMPPPPTTPARRGRERTEEETVAATLSLDRSASGTPFRTPSRSYGRLTRSQKRGASQDELPGMRGKRRVSMNEARRQDGSVQTELVLDASGMPSSPAVF